MYEVLQSISFEEKSKQVYVAFGFRSKDLDPLFITSELGIQPTNAFAKGEEYLGKERDPKTKVIRKKRQQRPWGVWSVDTKCLGLDRKVEEHIKYLLELLEPQKEIIKKYLDQPEKYLVIVNIWWEPANGHGSYEISSEILQRIASLCQIIDFGFISYES